MTHLTFHITRGYFDNIRLFEDQNDIRTIKIIFLLKIFSLSSLSLPSLYLFHMSLLSLSPSSLYLTSPPIFVSPLSPLLSILSLIFSLSLYLPFFSLLSPPYLSLLSLPSIYPLSLSLSFWNSFWKICWDVARSTKDLC